MTEIESVARIRRKKLMLILLLLVLATAVAWIAGRVQAPERTRVELGSPDMKSDLVRMLTSAGVSFTTETDHLGRVWIVSDPEMTVEFNRVHSQFESKLEQRRSSASSDSSSVTATVRAAQQIHPADPLQRAAPASAGR